LSSAAITAAAVATRFIAIAILVALAAVTFPSAAAPEIAECHCQTPLAQLNE
jgi:hypothetical protein